MTTQIRRQLLIAASAVTISLVATSVAAQNMTLTVPFRPGPRPQTAKVKIVFDSAAVAANATATIDGSATACAALPCNTLGTFGPGAADLVQLKTTATTAELTLDFMSDFAGNLCNSTRVANRSVTVNLTNINATGFRLASYSVPELTNAVPPGPPAPACSAAFRRINVDKASFTVAGGVTNLGRLPMDVILVLDKSGSMGWGLPGGPAGTDRWQRLQDSIGQFMALYKQAVGVLSGGETVEGHSADRIGLILFDSAITNANLNAGSIFKARGVALNGWDDAAGDIITAQLVPPPPNFSPGGATSIGGGISRANACWRFTDCLAAAATNIQDAVVVVFTDGEQNTAPCILSGAEVDNPGCTTTRIPPLKVSGTVLNTLNLPILTIGLGNVGASAELLDQIAHETAGQSRIAATGLVLDVAFADSLVRALKGNTLSLVKRFSENLSPAGPGTPMASVVDQSVRRVTWVLGWEGIRSPRAVFIEIRDPNNNVVKPAVLSQGAAYQVASADIPANGVGTWTARVVRTPGITGPVNYHFSAYAVDSRIDYRFTVLSGEFGTDKPVTIRGEMGYDTNRLSNLKTGNVRITVARPGENLGTILHTTEAGGTPQSGDAGSQSAMGAKVDTLAQKGNLVDRIQPKDLANSIVMTDRGNGVFEATFSGTVVGGKYLFRVDMDWEDGRTGKVQRTEWIERQVPVLPTAGGTQATVNWTQGSSTATVAITPRDRFGNYITPDQRGQFIVTVDAPAVVGPITNPGVNGTYIIPITGIAPGSDPNIRITYGRQTLRNSPLSKAANPGSSGIGGGWSIGVRGGLGNPEGHFGTDYDAGLAFEADAEKALNSNLAVQVVFGHNRFSDAGAGTLNVTRFGGNVKWYVPVSSARIFVTAGAGIYSFNPGDTKTGTNFGAGFQKDLNAKVAFEAVYNRHIVVTDGDNLMFSTYQGGIRIRF